MRFYVIVVILTIKAFSFVCQDENVVDESTKTPTTKLLLRDIKKSLVVNGEKVNLEAYYTNESRNIIINNIIKEYRLLEWYSIGLPVIIESEKSKKDKSRYFLHFTTKSIYGFVRMLTNEQKKIIVEEIRNIHNISIQYNQIEDLHYSKFDCKILLDGDDEDEETVLEGKVVSFESHPLKIEFKAGNYTKEQKWLRRFLTESIENIEFLCDIEGSNEKKNYILEKKNYKLKLQLGCSMRGSLACLNGGKCLSTGECECAPGFVGAICSECECIF